MTRHAGRFVRWIGFGILALAILCAGTWCTLAIWFRVSDFAAMGGVLAALAMVSTLLTCVSLATRWRWRAVAVYAALVGVVLVWWTTIHPSNTSDWAPDTARSVTGRVEGDRLVVSNVRNFTWRSDTDFDQRWEERTYDLSHIANADLIMSYWGNAAIAHTIMSFGFGGGSRLDFSIEIRKERGEAYSSITGFFKQYELAFVAADENDIVRVRTNIRHEDVQIYRLRMPPAAARRLLLEYIREANALASTPKFYNTLTTNCTTLVFQMVRVIHPALPLDYRVLLSGYLPEYAYSIGATATGLPFEELRARSRISRKAVRIGIGPDFPDKIREGIPAP